MLQKLKPFVLVLVGVLFLAVGQPVLAKVEDDSSVVTPQAYDYMYDAACLYTLNGSSIGVSGTTKTYSTVDKITTTLYLEKKTSSGWSIVKQWTNSKSNSTICNTTGSYTGVPGTTYRVRGYHRVDKGNLIETNSSYTYSFTID
ncbi:DUF6147 family protein [Desulforamulus ferrireducens]|uniref:Uncharacterized protein n=1 Tax=Desulforamulus ferrireducens TaxID=1833852 RepID=A0A1S6IZD5_9FIRM|nr:DUF6147 family protein [Desulforamulus ferrireducens]AQS60135.1 hypothetical protein B0537_14250 [Desulforamulus ferrireducens]